MIDPSTLGAQAAALTARIESEAGLLLSAQSRAAIHDVVLELLVKVANAEANLSLMTQTAAKWESVAGNRMDTFMDAVKVGESIRARHEELTNLATAVVEAVFDGGCNVDGSNVRRTMSALSAHLRGPGGGK